MLHSRSRSGLLLFPVLLAFGPLLRAQSLGTVTGSVRTLGAGTAIEGARIVLMGTKHLVVSSARGEFSLRNLEPGKYVIQCSAIGFATLSSEIEVRPQEVLQVDFQAQSETVRLTELAVVEAPRLPPEFVRRSEEGGGRYMGRAQIERRQGAATVADLLRTFPGVRVNCRRVPCLVEFTRTRRGCPPAFFLDGVQTDPMAVTLQPSREVDGIEVYSGIAETPPELKGRNNCGAFVVWTRTPPEGTRKPKAPKP